MAPKKQNAVPAVSAKADKEADLVMETNNSSIVSKRSVEMLYYPKPHFFRYFVKKPQRRSPVINRGYWLRMYAMAESVRRFMREPSDKPKFVVNLGCGFDPLPFMMLSAEKPLCRDTRFVDIDYEKLMAIKKTAIQRTSEITQLLENVEFFPDDKAVQIRSDHYLAIGCDLKNIKKLEDTLRNEVLPAECSVLFLAEVSLTYMDVESANAVVNWASKLSSDAQFCILEQFFPDRPDHPFASTMMKHFNKVGAPLHSIHEYPSLREQEQRFKNAGWTQAQARSLWDLWSDDDFLSSPTRASLDKVEVFDEWEEFTLFASHYFLLHASTREPTSDQRTEVEYTDPNVSNEFMLLPHCPQESDRRRYGAIIPDTDHFFGHHGGLGRQARLASTSLYGETNAVTRSSQPSPPSDISARMCHTVTPLAGDNCLLAGGRASPAAAFQDCWLRKGGQWQPIHSLPERRFRHSAVKVTLRDDSEGVLIYGGKTSDGLVLDSWILWSNNGNDWQAVETFGEKPPARFGACLEFLRSPTDMRSFEDIGVLCGGIGKDNTIIEDIWTWTFHQKEDGTYSLQFSDLTYRLQNEPLLKYITRFGATVNRTPWGVVIAGGIMPRQIVPSDKEILLLESKELLQRVESGDDRNGYSILTIGLGNNFNGPRPLWTGHVAHAVSPDQLVILGGGAVCYAFGAFWTQGIWVLKRADSTVENKWLLVSENARQAL